MDMSSNAPEQHPDRESDGNEMGDVTAGCRFLAQNSITQSIGDRFNIIDGALCFRFEFLAQLVTSTPVCDVCIQCVPS